MIHLRSNPETTSWRTSFLFAMMSTALFFGFFPVQCQETQTGDIPTYEQGEQAMYHTISEQIKYPESALSENRSGLVQVSFTVDENGDVKNVDTKAVKGGHPLTEVVVVGYPSPSQKAVAGVDDVLKAEGVRVVKQLGKFIPARKNGKPVSSVLILPIRFKLG